jgi:hypothetical protein
LTEADQRYWLTFNEAVAALETEGMPLSSKALRQRVNALESKLIGNPITLTLRDGSIYRPP